MDGIYVIHSISCSNLRQPADELRRQQLAGVGFEPTASGLWARRATTALPRNQLQRYCNVKLDKSKFAEHPFKAIKREPRLAAREGEGAIMRNLIANFVCLPRVLQSEEVARLDRLQPFA